MSAMDREDPLIVENVRNGPLFMFLKDGSRVNLQSNCVAVELSFLVGEEDEAYLMREGSAFSRLMAFSKVLGLLMDGYEEEILSLLEKLELRIKGKTVRQGTKKA